MEFYEASADIQASPDKIWSILTDASGMTSWDSGIARFDGVIADGEKIKAFPEMNPSRGFPARVGDVVEGRSMTWTGGMPLGLLKGVRTFTLTPAAEGTTRFHMREEFTGLMLGMIWPRMPDLQPSFDQFTAGLKATAESAD